MLKKYSKNPISIEMDFTPSFTIVITFGSSKYVNKTMTNVPEINGPIPTKSIPIEFVILLFLIPHET